MAHILPDTSTMQKLEKVFNMLHVDAQNDTKKYKKLAQQRRLEEAEAEKRKKREEEEAALARNNEISIFDDVADDYICEVNTTSKPEKKAEETTVNYNNSYDEMAIISSDTLTDASVQRDFDEEDFEMNEEDKESEEVKQMKRKLEDIKRQQDFLNEKYSGSGSGSSAGHDDSSIFARRSGGEQLWLDRDREEKRKRIVEEIMQEEEEQPDEGKPSKSNDSESAEADNNNSRRQKQPRHKNEKNQQKQKERKEKTKSKRDFDKVSQIMKDKFGQDISQAKKQRKK